MAAVGASALAALPGGGRNQCEIHRRRRDAANLGEYQLHRRLGWHDATCIVPPEVDLPDIGNYPNAVQVTYTVALPFRHPFRQN